MGLKVEKERHKVTIIMDNLKVRGYIHLMPKSRLTDVLNSTNIKDFIPITEAELTHDGETVYLQFVEINKHKINAIYLCDDNVIVK